MKVLAIESAALVASAALADDGAVLAEMTLNTKLTHSQTLLPMIGELLEKTGLRGEELDAHRHPGLAHGARRNGSPARLGEGARARRRGAGRGDRHHRARAAPLPHGAS